MSAPAIDEAAGAIDVTSDAKLLTAMPSLITGVVEDSGALWAVRGAVPPSKSYASTTCSGAVNGTTIWTTNQSAISRVRRRGTVFASDTRRVPTKPCARVDSYALSVRPHTAE